MRGVLTVKKLTIQFNFLQILFREDAATTAPENSRVFTIGSRPIRFCEAEYIQNYGKVYRNSYFGYFLPKPLTRTSDKRDISR